MSKRMWRIAALSAGLVAVGPAVIMALPDVSTSPSPVSYAVAVDGGSFAQLDLAIHSVTLIDCEPSTSWIDDLRSVFGTVAGGNTVMAGHSSAVDPAAIEGQWIASAGGDQIVLGSATLGEPAYCDVHLSFADRVPGTTANTGPTVMAISADGTSMETTVSWGAVIHLTDAEGNPVTVEPDEGLSIDIMLSVGDLDGQASGDPVDVLRSLVINSSATV